MEKSPSTCNRTQNRIQPQDIVIYTDGSKLESGTTGSAYVAYKNNTKIMTWSVPLRQSNSVFQAELLAMHKAVEGTQWMIIIASARSANQQLNP